MVLSEVSVRRCGGECRVEGWCGGECHLRKVYWCHPGRSVTKDKKSHWSHDRIGDEIKRPQNLEKNK